MSRVTESFVHDRRDGADTCQDFIVLLLLLEHIIRSFRDYHSFEWTPHLVRKIGVVCFSFAVYDSLTWRT